MEVDMPAAKKKKKLSTDRAATVKLEKKVEKMSEHMQMLLFVFAIAMIMFAFVLYSNFA